MLLYTNSVVFFVIVYQQCGIFLLLYTNSVVFFLIVLGNCTNSVVFFVIYFITRYKTHSELVASKKKKPVTLLQSREVFEISEQN